MIKKRAFTLIELLIVIAIIGILTTAISIVLVDSQKKAKNAKKQADFGQMFNALQLFYSEKNRMPLNYNPGHGACEGDGYYEKSMQELVDAKIISKIPRSPSGIGGQGGYCYYDYGSTPGDRMVLLATTLNGANTTEGRYNSCRPVVDPDNWCSRNRNSGDYCACQWY